MIYTQKHGRLNLAYRKWGNDRQTFDLKNFFQFYSKMERKILIQ
jgi:hypothetical protein